MNEFRILQLKLILMNLRIEIMIIKMPFALFRISKKKGIK